MMNPAQMMNMTTILRRTSRMRQKMVRVLVKKHWITHGMTQRMRTVTRYHSIHKRDDGEQLFSLQKEGQANPKSHHL